MKQSDSSQVMQSIQNFFHAQAFQSRQESLCPRCGKAMQHLDITFWLYETDSRCNMQLPVCSCETREPEAKDCILNSEVATSPISTHWKELYKAVLLEEDKSKLLGRIAQAQLALNLRARELFHAEGEEVEERRAVDAAIHALQALRGTCGESRKGARRLGSNATRVA